jgi:hypothetical protein
MNHDTRAEILQDLEDDELVVRSLVIESTNYKVRVAYLKLLRLIRILREDI